jgi:hypothetical protein
MRFFRRQEMKKLLKTRISILLAILFCFVCVPVQAEMITIAITGQITVVDDQYGHLEHKIHSGDTITGTYSYDSAMLDSSPSSALGDYVYNVSPAGISLNCGGFNFRTNSDNVDFLIEISDNYTLQSDNYLLRSYNNLPLSNGALVDHIFWQLDDSTGTALSSDALPLTAPDLSKWGSGRYDNQLGIVGREFGIGATVTSAVLIPEPITVFLLGFGIILAKRRLLNQPSKS